MNRVHELKIWPPYFDSVRSGLKTYEVRRNDRGFQVGDMLRLQEWDRTHQEPYSGREVSALVVHIHCLAGPPTYVGMEEGWVVLGIKVLIP